MRPKNANANSATMRNILERSRLWLCDFSRAFILYFFWGSDCCSGHLGNRMPGNSLDLVATGKRSTESVTVLIIQKANEITNKKPTHTQKNQA